MTTAGVIAVLRTAIHQTTRQGDCRGLGYLHVQALDTSTPSGRAMFGMLSVFAELERSLISERVRAGLARSTKKGGRPPLDPKKHQRIVKLLHDGVSINETARTLKCGVATVHRIKTAMAVAA